MNTLCRRSLGVLFLVATTCLSPAMISVGHLTREQAEGSDVGYLLKVTDFISPPDVPDRQSVPPH